MSVEMCAKFLEEVNKLADQLSRLTLSDEIEKPSDVTACGDVMCHDSELIEDKESTCVIANDNALPQEKDMFSADVVKQEEEKNTSSVKETCTKFYAVALPAEAKRPADPSTLVYSDFKEALKAAKSFKGSRFKEFANKENALLFASKSLDSLVAKAKADEEGSTYRSATSQELCLLRKYIECGNEIMFSNTVWNHPKILVGSCDTPTIMQEGMRYNALHVAAKCNKPFLCQLVLDTIENPKFLKLIYPLKSDDECRKIVNRLLDLYINTPDKKTGDTPLHYASKFGCVDCVKVLLAHPFCVLDRKNIAGFTAREIICNRAKTKSPSLIEEIDDAFEGLIYIPILRSEANDVPPIVGKPSSCKEIVGSTRGLEPKDAESVLALKAFIGPMSPKFAEQLYLVIKKPTSHQAFFYSPEDLDLEAINRIRYTDREKGLERFCRWLADDLNFQWQEYFSFLNIFTNLASEDGLKALENYLYAGQSDYVPDEQDEKSVHLVHQYPSHINPLAHYVNVHLEREKEKYDSNYVDMYGTPPSSPWNDPDADYFLTPPSSPSYWTDEVFLQGSCVSKLDVDALLAINDATVDYRVYPNVAKWKRTVEREVTNAKDEKISRLNFLTSAILPRLRISENICTPRKTLLNKAFRYENSA